MRTFEELTAIAKSGGEAGGLSGIECNAVHGLRGLLLQYKHSEIDKQELKIRSQAVRLHYEHAVQEQAIHHDACIMRVEMAQVNKEMELHGCELCRRALKIMDRGTRK